MRVGLFEFLDTLGGLSPGSLEKVFEARVVLGRDGRTELGIDPLAKANAAMWKNIFAIDTVNRSAIVCVVVKVFSLV